MNGVWLVGVGGGIGAIARHLLGTWVTTLSPDARFPVKTLVVNVLGCLVAGLLAGWAERNGAFAEEWRLFLFTGLLGGFTTFSAFGLETVNLLRRGETGVAVAYVASSVALGVAVQAIGFAAARGRM